MPSVDILPFNTLDGQATAGHRVYFAVDGMQIDLETSVTVSIDGSEVDGDMQSVVPMLDFVVGMATFAFDFSGSGQPVGAARGIDPFLGMRVLSGSSRSMELSLNSVFVVNVVVTITSPDGDSYESEPTVMFVTDA